MENPGNQSEEGTGAVEDPPPAAPSLQEQSTSESTSQHQPQPEQPEQERRPPPPLSPLTGSYLLIIVGEPHSETHKEIILQKIAKAFLSWDVNECHVSLEKELQVITGQSPEGEEARYGERLIQYATENLVTEILIHPQLNTLHQCLKNLLSSFTKHRHIIHAGYTFAGNGSWILQDGTLSISDLIEALHEPDVLRVLKAYENSVSIDVHCASEGDWTTERFQKEPVSKLCNIRINPGDVMTAGNPAISAFMDYLSPFLEPANIQQLLQPTDVVGNIRFTHPTLYVFPGGQGDAALFGINGFNMLIDGGFARKACFWDFARHLDRLDAVLLTRLNNSTVNGISAVLQRKKMNHVYPQIGHFFCNLQDRKIALSPDGDKDKDSLIVNLAEEGQEIVANLRHLALKPHPCYRDGNQVDPVNLYHKVGHGKLDMYVISPARDSQAVKEFLAKWSSNDSHLFSNTGKKVPGKSFEFPLQNLVSICALLVWQPANPNDTITRILFPGSTPQHKIFEGLEKLRHLEFLKHPVCSAKSISPSVSTTTVTRSLSKTRQMKPADNKQKETKILAKPQVKPTKPKMEKTPPKELKPKIDNKLVDAKNELENVEEPLKKLDNRILSKDEQIENIKKEIQKIEQSENEEQKKKIIHRSKYDMRNVKSKVDSRAPSKSIDRKKAPEKKPEGEASPPGTPKKLMTNGTASKTEKAKEKQSKPSPTSTPAKSAKEENNRKVVEARVTTRTSLLGKTMPKKKEDTPHPVAKTERKPISRRPKTSQSPVKTSKPKTEPGEPVPKKIQRKPEIAMKTAGLIISKELEKGAETEKTEIDDGKIEIKKLEKETTENKETDIKAVKRELESAQRKDEEEEEEDEEEEEEYLIITKEEYGEESAKEEESGKENEEEIQTEGEGEMKKLLREEEESEKKRETTDAKDEKEETEKKEDEKTAKIAEESAEGRESELQRLMEVDEGIDLKEPVSKEHKEGESLPEEKISNTLETSATTAPTLPEDERIEEPVQEEKEQPEEVKEVIEEKYIQEETKEEKKEEVVPEPEQPSVPTTINVEGAFIPPQVSTRKHPRDIVKTPDEVAELPMHEEVDPRMYSSGEYTKDLQRKTEEKPDYKDMIKGEANFLDEDVTAKKEDETQPEESAVIAKYLNIIDELEKSATDSKKEPADDKKTEDRRPSQSSGKTSPEKPGKESPVVPTSGKQTPQEVEREPSGVSTPVDTVKPSSPKPANTSRKTSLAEGKESSRVSTPVDSTKLESGKTSPKDLAKDHSRIATSVDTTKPSSGRTTPKDLPLETSGKSTPQELDKPRSRVSTPVDSMKPESGKTSPKDLSKDHSRVATPRDLETSGKSTPQELEKPTSRVSTPVDSTKPESGKSSPKDHSRIATPVDTAKPSSGRTTPRDLETSGKSTPQEKPTSRVSTPVDSTKPESGKTSPKDLVKDHSRIETPVDTIKPSSGRSTPRDLALETSGKSTPQELEKPASRVSTPVDSMKPESGKTSPKDLVEDHSRIATPIDTAIISSGRITPKDLPLETSGKSTPQEVEKPTSRVSTPIDSTKPESERTSPKDLLKDHSRVATPGDLETSGKSTPQETDKPASRVSTPVDSTKPESGKSSPKDIAKDHSRVTTPRDLALETSGKSTPQELDKPSSRVSTPIDSIKPESGKTSPKDLAEDHSRFATPMDTTKPSSGRSTPRDLALETSGKSTPQEKAFQEEKPTSRVSTPVDSTKPESGKSSPKDLAKDHSRTATPVDTTKPSSGRTTPRDLETSGKSTPQDLEKPKVSTPVDTMKPSSGKTTPEDMKEEHSRTSTPVDAIKAVSGRVTPKDLILDTTGKSTPQEQEKPTSRTSTPVESTQTISGKTTPDGIVKEHSRISTPVDTKPDSGKATPKDVETDKTKEKELSRTSTPVESGRTSPREVTEKTLGKEPLVGSGKSTPQELQKEPSEKAAPKDLALETSGKSTSQEKVTSRTSTPVEPIKSSSGKTTPEDIAKDHSRSTPIDAIKPSSGRTTPLETSGRRTPQEKPTSRVSTPEDATKPEKTTSPDTEKDKTHPEKETSRISTPVETIKPDSGKSTPHLEKESSRTSTPVDSAKPEGKQPSRVSTPVESIKSGKTTPEEQTEVLESSRITPIDSAKAVSGKTTPLSLETSDKHSPEERDKETSRTSTPAGVGSEKVDIGKTSPIPKETKEGDLEKPKSEKPEDSFGKTSPSELKTELGKEISDGSAPKSTTEDERSRKPSLAGTQEVKAEPEDEKTAKTSGKSTPQEVEPSGELKDKSPQTIRETSRTSTPQIEIETSQKSTPRDLDGDAETSRSPKEIGKDISGKSTPADMAKDISGKSTPQELDVEISKISTPREAASRKSTPEVQIEIETSQKSTPRDLDGDAETSRSPKEIGKDISGKSTPADMAKDISGKSTPQELDVEISKISTPREAASGKSTPEVQETSKKFSVGEISPETSKIPTPKDVASGKATPEMQETHKKSSVGDIILETSRISTPKEATSGKSTPEVQETSKKSSVGEIILETSRISTPKELTSGNATPEVKETPKKFSVGEISLETSKISTPKEATSGKTTPEVQEHLRKSSVGEIILETSKIATPKESASGKSTPEVQETSKKSSVGEIILETSRISTPKETEKLTSGKSTPADISKEVSGKSSPQETSRVSTPGEIGRSEKSIPEIKNLETSSISLQRETAPESKETSRKSSLAGMSPEPSKGTDKEIAGKYSPHRETPRMSTPGETEKQKSGKSTPESTQIETSRRTSLKDIPDSTKTTETSRRSSLVRMNAEISRTSPSEDHDTGKSTPGDLARETPTETSRIFTPHEETLKYISQEIVPEDNRITEKRETEGIILKKPDSRKQSIAEEEESSRKSSIGRETIAGSTKTSRRCSQDTDAGKPTTPVEAKPQISVSDSASSGPGEKDVSGKSTPYSTDREISGAIGKITSDSVSIALAEKGTSRTCSLEKETSEKVSSPSPVDISPLSLDELKEKEDSPIPKSHPVSRSQLERIKYEDGGSSGTSTPDRSHYDRSEGSLPNGVESEDEPEKGILESERQEKESQILDISSGEEEELKGLGDDDESEPEIVKDVLTKEIAKEEKEDFNKLVKTETEEESKVVKRMLVTASSEDGGTETEICIKTGEKKPEESTEGEFSNLILQARQEYNAQRSRKTSYNSSEEAERTKEEEEEEEQEEEEEEEEEEDEDDGEELGALLKQARKELAFVQSKNRAKHETKKTTSEVTRMDDDDIITITTILTEEREEQEDGSVIVTTTKETTTKGGKNEGTVVTVNTNIERREDRARDDSEVKIQEEETSRRTSASSIISQEDLVSRKDSVKIEDFRQSSTEMSPLKTTYITSHGDSESLMTSSFYGNLPTEDEMIGRAERREFRKGRGYESFTEVGPNGERTERTYFYGSEDDPRQARRYVKAYYTEEAEERKDSPERHILHYTTTSSEEGTVERTRFVQRYYTEEPEHESKHRVVATVTEEPGEHMDFGKAIDEHVAARGEYLGREDLAKYGRAKPEGESSSKKDVLEGWGKPLGLPLPPKNKFHGQNISTTSTLSTPSTDTSDSVSNWGHPMNLPSPAPPSTVNGTTEPGKGTPIKEKKIQPKKNPGDKSSGTNTPNRRSESPVKFTERRTPSTGRTGKPGSVHHVYMDLTYVPHHGNSYYSNVEFFKRVRARYYVFSGTEPSKEVYNALLEAKQTWEDKKLEVTIIPTYDTDVLGYWVAENEEILAKHKIDLSPSASRCTINLQDHETSCSAYRLEF